MEHVKAPINTSHSFVCLTLVFAWSVGSVAKAESVSFEMQAASAETYGVPHNIVLSPDGVQLYVADNENHRIVVLDAQSLKEQGVFAKDEVSAPHDVAFDARGRLLVADTGNHRIAIYEVAGAGGKFVGDLQGRIRLPEGVAVHRDGRVFATGASSSNLVVYRDGKVVGEVGGFSSPHGVAIDRQGGIWVADASNDRLVRLNDALEITTVLSGKVYAFNGPRYIAFDAGGRLYVADKYANSIKVIAPDGKLIAVLGRDKAGKGEGVFDRPEGVEIRGNDIWFSDTYNNRIVRYRFEVTK